MIRVRRVYETPLAEDGERLLIDRLWPRGLTKANARIDRWARELAPGDELRTWFGHDPERFPRFRERYRGELLQHREALIELARESSRRPVTLVFAAKDEHHSNATVLKELLDELGD